MRLADLSAITELPKPSRSFGKATGLWLSDMFVILGVALALLLLLAAVIYLWAKWRNKRRRHVSGGERVYRGSTAGSSEEAVDAADEDADADAGESSRHDRRRYKYRVRRRTHRSRNPTLSETGGLPPAKSREPSQPC